MLTRILIGYALRTAGFVVGAGVLLGFLLMGGDFARALALGGVLTSGSGALQIWLVGFLLDPAQGTPQKVACGSFLLLKLLFIGGVLWWSLTQFGPDQLGILCGMGLGLLSLVVGLSRGAQSEEGMLAMDEDEKKIAEKIGDTEDENG